MAKLYAKKFYASKSWRNTRNAYFQSKHGLCEECGEAEKRMIVHHKNHITPQNINDVNITLNWDNLQLLCLTCHNKTHFEKYSPVKDGFGFDEYGNFIEKGK